MPSVSVLFGMTNMTVLLVFGLFVVLAWAHRIKELEVPLYGDPRHPSSLVCHYVSDADDPPLHSVKWYRGNDEIFRYMPGQQPTTRAFNSSTHGGVSGTCSQHSCAINVMLPQLYNSKVPFTCEVSTEGPRFAVAKETKNLTIAVVLKEDPVITGVPGSVQFGEDLTVNCSTAAAMPPANIVWFIDGKPERLEPWVANNTHVSAPDKAGLRRSWRALRVRVANSKGNIALRCEATQPTLPPYVRVAESSIMVARSPHLSMFTASGSSSIVESNGLITTISAVVHILFTKYSALCDIASKLL